MINDPRLPTPLNADQRARAAAMSEDELMEHIRKLASFYDGVLVFHDHDSRRSWGPGYPDLTIVGDYGLIWRECKAENGRLTVDQRRWGSKIEKSGGNWQVWRPTQYLNGTVGSQLIRISRPR